MKYSLLYKKDDDPAVCQIIYDISADRAVERFEEDGRKSEYFLKVLSDPLTDTRNIIYRQEIMKDFDSNPELLSELKKLFTRYDRIRSDWQQTRLSAPDNLPALSTDARLEYYFSSLKAVAAFPSTIGSFYESIGKLLSEFNIKSEAFTSMRDYSIKISASEEFKDITETALVFRHGELSDFTYTVSFEATDGLIPANTDILSVDGKRKSAGIKEKFLKKKGSTTDTAEIVSSISDTGNDPYSCSAELLCEAFGRLNDLISEVTGNLYDTFYGISTELVFYEVAAKYISAARVKGIALAYPEMLDAEKDYIELAGVSDLLLMSDDNCSRIITNDLPLRSDYNGLVVRGMTDSGKTVYLRAVAAAQLFAQAGLPVLAERAVLSVRHGFFSHFSSAEEEFMKKNARGRFDQEAGELAAIIGELKPYSLLLLNETFQTTSYKEGTESIYNILRYMPYLKTKYVFVTHLVNLFDYMKDENVLLAQTSSDEDSKYKILFNSEK